MKKICLMLVLLITSTSVVLAQETIPHQNVEENKAIVSIQKQPANETQSQSIVRNIGCIIIQVNGKVSENDKTSK